MRAIVRNISRMAGQRPMIPGNSCVRPGSSGVRELQGPHGEEAEELDEQGEAVLVRRASLACRKST